MAKPEGKNINFLAPFLVIASMTSLTVGASIAKNLFKELGPAGTTVLRLGIASILMIFVSRVWRVKINKSNLYVLVAYGVGLGLMNLAFYEAIARLPIGIAIAIEFLGPLSITFYYSKNRLDFVWATLALLGVVLLLPLTEVQASLDMTGVFFAFLAAAAWAFYILIGKKAGNAAPFGVVTAIGTFVGCLTVLPFGAHAALDVFSKTELIPLAIAVGILSSAIPYSLEIIAMKSLDSKTFGILLSLEPAIGTLAAFLFLKEQLTATQFIAIACVIAASIGGTMTASRRAKPLVL